jgi:hypothetical protein
VIECHADPIANVLHNSIGPYQMISWQLECLERKLKLWIDRCWFDRWYGTMEGERKVFFNTVNNEMKY